MREANARGVKQALLSTQPGGRDITDKKTTRAIFCNCSRERAHPKSLALPLVPRPEPSLFSAYFSMEAPLHSPIYTQTLYSCTCLASSNQKGIANQNSTCPCPTQRGRLRSYERDPAATVSGIAACRSRAHADAPSAEFHFGGRFACLSRPVKASR